MAIIDVTIPNMDRLLDALAAYPDISRPILSQALRDVMTLLTGKAQTYPAEPAGSTYTRTGALGRRWASAPVRLRTTGSAIEGRVGNDTPYGPYVQSDEDQAWMHVGRWTTVGQILKENEAAIIQLLAAANDRIVAEVERRAR